MSDWLAPLDRWAKDLGVLGLFDGLPQTISNARKLAEGRLSLVIVVIEPCNNHAMTSYHEMVEKSPTLQEVRRLIRAHFDCDLDDVPVFDVRPLISERMRNDLEGKWPAWEEKAHRVFEEMLLIKRPDVILSLQCATNNSKSAISRSICGNLRVSLQPRIVALGSYETLVFRGFHPSVNLRTDYAADTIDWTTSESMLSLCFKAAFSALNGRRFVRWNGYNSTATPGQFLCSVIAREHRKDAEYARNMSPVELYENINHRVPPNMQSALYDQVLVENKLRQLAQINHGHTGHLED